MGLPHHLQLAQLAPGWGGGFLSPGAVGFEKALTCPGKGGLSERATAMGC